MKFSTKQYKNHSVYQSIQNFLNKKVQNIIHKQEIKKWSFKRDPEMTQIIELAEKDVKQIL